MNIDSIRVREGRRLAALLLAGLLAAPAASLAANGDCGQPSSLGAGPLASDAQFVLKAAVGSKTCDLCVCDVTNDGKIAASDALRLLKKAVGQAVTLTCPACLPPLNGTVRIPSMLGSSLTALAASGNGRLDGLVPAAGVTVELFHLDADGTLQLPAAATTSSKDDGTFTLKPLPSPSSRTIVRATIGGAQLRAFVTGDNLDLTPESEFLVGKALAAAAALPSPGLNSLTVAEIDALHLLVTRDIVHDFSASATITAAVKVVDDSSGGVYAGLVADFTNGNGPTTAMAGAYHVVNFGGSCARFFQAGSIGVSSVNERSVEIHDSEGPVVIDGAGAISTGTINGNSHTFSEVSGTTPQDPGPDVVANPVTTVSSEDTTDVPASGGVLMASNHGALMLRDGDNVAAGAFASGSNFGALLGFSSQPQLTEADATVTFALRQGSGLDNSSLSGTYSAVQFENEVYVSDEVSWIQGGILAASMGGVIAFDGNGHVDFGPTATIGVELQKRFQHPDQPAAAPDILLTQEPRNEGERLGLAYTVSPVGEVLVKDGATTIGVGAVSADLGVVVLRFDDDTPDFPKARYMIAVKRGSGMGNGSGQGHYRMISFETTFRHDEQPGSTDVTPSWNQRSVAFDGGLGSFDMDGAGTLTVQPSVYRDATQHENSGVLSHAMGDDEVFDADVTVGAGIAHEGNGTETHTYAVSSKGVVLIDGTLEGALSGDGKVFLLPQTETDASDQKTSNILIALRQP